MKSTNYNITNPMKIDSIDLIPYEELVDLPIVKCITQSEYNEMPYHDEYTIYVILDVPKRAYRGAMLIDTNNKVCEYLIGTKIIDNKIYYVIYMNTNESMIEICKYISGRDALKSLTLFNRIGTHEPIEVQIYSILKSYVMDDINFLSMLISIISKLGFKDHPDLQKIIELQDLNLYRCRNSKDVPLIIIEKFDKLRNNMNNLILDTYKEIYELLYEINLNDKLEDVARSIINIGYKNQLI